MKKKLLAVIAALFIAGTANVFAIGIGAQGGFSAGTNNVGGALTFSVSDPWYFAVTIDGIGSNGIAVGVTADNWLANKKIQNTWGWYYGWGVAGSVAIAGDSLGIGVAPRLLIGTNIRLAKVFELYLQAAWQPTLNIGVSGDSAGIGFTAFCIPVNFGFRFWF
ncbi:MAG: hypothetical protein MJ182_05680 [Treponema sp.]|nr:hypothetical protein [Treponema sp.]